jgi:hypothetical protein
MRNIADVTGGIAIRFQSISGMTAINPLVAYMDDIVKTKNKNKHNHIEQNLLFLPTLIN